MNSELELGVRPDKQPVAARSEVYRILSGVFTYPASAEQKDFVLQEARAALHAAAAELPFPIPALDALAEWGTESMPDVQGEYTRLFDNCSGRPALSLYEKDFSRIDQKILWEELIRYYEHFGLRYDLGDCREWPDHIGIELEFLHYLTFLEAAVPDAMTEDYVAAEDDFLERHLAKWVPQFSEKLGDGDAPYNLFGQVLAQFIAGERELNRERRPIQ